MNFKTNVTVFTRGEISGKKLCLLQNYRTSSKRQL